MRYRVEHRTYLHFDSPVWEHQVELRLTPRHDATQRLHSVDISVSPDAKPRVYRDSFGNLVQSLSLIEPHDELEVSLVTEVEPLRENPFAFESLTPASEPAWIRDQLQQNPRLWDYTYNPESVEASAHELEEANLDLPQLDQAAGVMASIQKASTWVTEKFEYRPGATQVHSTLREVLKARAGVCQDFAHLLIMIARNWGVPARYVMGYHDAEVDAEEPGAPHAWAEVLIPGAGWLGFDATNGLVVNDSYVAVAVGRNSLDAAPVRGSFKGDGEGREPEVELQILRAQQQ